MQKQQQQQRTQKSSTIPQMPQQNRESMGKEGHMKTRDIGILVYIRDKERIDLRNIYEDEEEEKREHIANLVINKKAVDRLKA